MAGVGPDEQQRHLRAVVHRAHRDLLRPVAAPPERHQVQVHRRGQPPRPGVRVIGHARHPRGDDRERPHLGAPALGLARPRADQVHQVPGVGAVGPVAHRHRAARHPGHDAAIELGRIGIALEHAHGEVARARRIPGLVLLLLGAVALAGRAVAGRAGVGEALQGELARLGREWRARGDVDDTGTGLPLTLVGRGRHDERRGSERLDVVHERPALLLGEMTPRGHGRARHAARDRAVEILVGRHALPRGDEPVGAGDEIARPGVEQVGRLAVAAPARPVARCALLAEEPLAQGQERGRCHRRRRGRQRGRPRLGRGRRAARAGGGRRGRLTGGTRRHAHCDRHRHRRRAPPPPAPSHGAPSLASPSARRRSTDMTGIISGGIARPAWASRRTGVSHSCHGETQ